MKIIRFVKLANRWFADLPEYEGSADDLQMVDGADTFLEAHSDGKNEIKIWLYDEPNYQYNTLCMNRKSLDYLGATYEINAPHYKGDIWICPVTLTVFGEYPENIYFAIL